MAKLLKGHGGNLVVESMEIHFLVSFASENATVASKRVKLGPIQLTKPMICNKGATTRFTAH